jgi:hypothetical protein
MPPYPRLTEVKIQGYRPFRNFTARLSPLEIMVGANGAGKSSLFEFLKFLRDSIYAEIPPEIIPGSIGQQIFHIPGFRGLTVKARGGPGEGVHPLRCTN